MKKENAVIFGVTGVVFAAALIGGGIYMKTERDRNLNADTASTAADSNRAEEVQKAVFLAEDSGLWYLGDLEHGNIYVTHTPSDTLYDENGNAIDPSEIKDSAGKGSIGNSVSESVLHTAKCPGDSYGNTGRLYLVLC